MGVLQQVSTVNARNSAILFLFSYTFSMRNAQASTTTCIRTQAAFVGIAYIHPSLFLPSYSVSAHSYTYMRAHGVGIIFDMRKMTFKKWLIHRRVWEFLVNFSIHMHFPLRINGMTCENAMTAIASANKIFGQSKIYLKVLTHFRPKLRRVWVKPIGWISWLFG